jgi:hypothetical protein
MTTEMVLSAMLRAPRLGLSLRFKQKIFAHARGRDALGSRSLCVFPDQNGCEDFLWERVFSRLGLYLQCRYGEAGNADSPK